MNNHYWNELLVGDAFTPTHKNRYIAFDIDQGGLNNIRMVFEYAVVIAAITRRTLVLPPSQPWYLINQAAQGKAEGTTDLADVFELSSIGKAIPCLTTMEFCQKAKNHLSIPNEFLTHNYDGLHANRHLLNWRKWLLQNSETIDWNSYESLLCHPSIKHALNGPHMSDHYIANRRLKELTPRQLASPVIYLPSDDNYRSLGPVATMLATETEHLPRICRRLLKHHVRYREEVFSWAEKICHWHHLDDFNAIHIRRNDFQYKQTRLDVDRIHTNIQPLLDTGKPLYVATDETDPEFFRQLAGHFKVPRVYTINDWLSRTGPDFPYVWEGLVEQAICARASIFVGTDLSTFSAYVTRLRGYMQVKDQNCYYHTINYNNDIPEEIPFQGREYLRENPLFWQDC